MVKAKEIFKRTMKVSQTDDKDTKRAEGNDSHTEKATFTDGSGDKATLTLSQLPPGLKKGSVVSILITTSQSKIEDHT